MAQTLQLRSRVTFKYKPLHDRVLVRIDPDVEPTEEKKTDGGIILVESHSASSGNGLAPQLVTVVEIGEGEILYDGRIRRLAVRAKDRVLVDKANLHPVEDSYDPTKAFLCVVSERDIICVVEDA